MKTFIKACDQGELSFLKISDKFVRPEGGTRVKPTGGWVVVGHSETGHHHVMLAERTEVYQLPNNLLKLQMVVKDPDELTHLRDFDTHEPIRFEPGTYQVTRLREYDALEGWRAQMD
jgi:hypothetical protein